VAIAAATEVTSNRTMLETVRTIDDRLPGRASDGFVGQTHSSPRCWYPRPGFYLDLSSTPAPPRSLRAGALIATKGDGGVRVDLDFNSTTPALRRRRKNTVTFGVKGMGALVSCWENH
jgi:hypothetical protein